MLMLSDFDVCLQLKSDARSNNRNLKARKCFLYLCCVQYMYAFEFIGSSIYYFSLLKSILIHKMTNNVTMPMLFVCVKLLCKFKTQYKWIIDNWKKVIKIHRLFDWFLAAINRRFRVWMWEMAMYSVRKNQ